MIYIDITDFLLYIRQRVKKNMAIIPTGIERVMLEFITHGLLQKKVKCVYFSQYTKKYLEFPGETIFAIYNSDLPKIQHLSNIDVFRTNLLRICVRYRHRYIKIILTALKYFIALPFYKFSWYIFIEKQSYQPAIFRTSDTILFLCAPCILRNFDFIKSLKAKHSLCLTMLIHDIMPITLDIANLPSTSLKLETDFFIRKGSEIIDKFLVTTEYWKKILNQYLQNINRGNAIPIDIIKLGFSGKSNINENEYENIKHRIVQGSFILTIGTIEVRKNHITLVQAWNKLLKSKKLANHKLVIVGKWGWKVEELKEYLATNPELNSHIIILNNVKDQELDTLYKYCSFTVFPSIAEGYGLPIVESIYHGKLCITSNTTAMPEVGGIGADYINNPFDIEELAIKIEFYLHNPESLAKRNMEVKQMKLTTWQEASDKLYHILENK
jgi:glycosyltransferase involved in cell wall biosynthesis